MSLQKSSCHPRRDSPRNPWPSCLRSRFPRRPESWNTQSKWRGPEQVSRADHAGRCEIRPSRLLPGRIHLRPASLCDFHRTLPSGGPRLKVFSVFGADFFGEASLLAAERWNRASFFFLDGAALFECLRASFGAFFSWGRRERWCASELPAGASRLAVCAKPAAFPWLPEVDSGARPPRKLLVCACEFQCRRHSTRGRHLNPGGFALR